MPPFGTGLGRSGVSLGHSWAPSWQFGVRLTSSVVKGFVHDGLPEAFWIDVRTIEEELGSVLREFGSIFGWMLSTMVEGSGKILPPPPTS